MPSRGGGEAGRVGDAENALGQRRKQITSMASEEAVQSWAAKEAPRVGDGEKSTGVVLARGTGR
jgi:hypothetical protein